MKRAVHFLIVATLAAEVLVLGQGNDVEAVLAAARSALGGDTLASVTSLTATGRTTRQGADAPAPTDFELAIQLPDRYVKKEVVAVMGDSTIARTTGFNGDGLIEAMDVPQGLFGGGGSGQMMVRSTSGGGTTTFGGPGGRTVTADEASRKANVVLSKQEFARLTLGLFANAFSAYPLRFTAGTAADAADGKADVIIVTGDGDFAAKLYIDRQSHLPVMLTWMAKEPLVRSTAMRAGGPAGAGPMIFQSGQAIPPDQQGQPAKDFEADMKKAEANRRLVEFRMAYGDYKVVSGVKWPTRLRRSVDGKATDEMSLEKITINPKIDPKKFDVVK